jgi:mannose-6-phosphate isomerase
LGDDVVVFEIQQNSDVTFRLFDWNHVDAKTHQPRQLQVEEALACVDFAKGPVHPQTPVVAASAPERERLVDCAYFALWRIRSAAPFPVGAAGVPRVLVCIEGAGDVEHAGAKYPVKRGEVLLLPAAVGVCAFRPSDTATLLEVGVGP